MKTRTDNAAASGREPGGIWPAWGTLRAPALVSLLWCLCLLALYHWTMRRENEYVDELVRLQTGTFYSSIVATRAWNARHGGVWVEADERCPVNPWIPEDKRSLATSDGRTLALVNPAYMTRQIADFTTPSLATFRIVGLNPVRPGNLADMWEARALRSFADGAGEISDLVSDPDGARYRYIAPLPAERTCLSCHRSAAVGDLLGGISVSIAAEPFLEAAAQRKRITGIAYSCIGMLGIVGIGGATLQINRKKEQAEAANRMKSAFLANMSHDMRTPLTGMLGMTELLESDAAVPEQRRLLAHLRDATGSLLEVVDGIMRYALLEAEGRARSAVPFSLRAELTACLKVLRPACESKGVALRLEIDPQTPDALLGEGFRLRQALGNLLGNAVKFTERGAVTLRVECLERDIAACLMRFQVIDTGAGIPPGECGRIFDSFVQGAAGEAAPQTGVGLGLSIARTIARRLGGDVTVRSAVGQGSTFTLTARFRLAPAGARPVPAEGEAPSAPVVPSGAFLPEVDLTGRRIVAAEDTPITALFLHEALTRAGAETRMATDAAGALALLREVRPDLLLLDMRMPGGTGLSVAEAVRGGEAGVPADLPILLLSASTSPEQEAEAERLGINGRLRKPIRAESLARAVAELLPRPLSGPADSAGVGDTPAVFDAAAALDDMDGDAALLRRLCLLFLDEAPSARAALEEAGRLTEAADSPTRRSACLSLRDQAHRLKNGAATLHLSALRLSCMELEETARAAVDAADNARIRSRLALRRVLRTFDQACAALRDTADQG